MSHSIEMSKSRSITGSQPFPPGRIKIAEALKQLLAEKEFGAITTAEIARTAGVTEGLIYKYFDDKRDLLHQVLAEYMEFFLNRAEHDLKGIKGALNKLRKLVWSHLYMYATDRVFARILVFEVRNCPDYFKSDAYQIVRRYGRLLEEILEEGVRAGEIREDVPPGMMRQLILGGIEHACLPGLIFNVEIPVDMVAENLCALLFEGIAKRG
ncbi:MAG: TetR/AcrR family transcriptional regulator [Desulfomonile sp.]|nr:TetR/AcrR family transcriptional regulator [Desulfomonile sp.]